MTELRDKIKAVLDHPENIHSKFLPDKIENLAMQAQVDLLESLRIKVMKFKDTSDVERMLYDEIQTLEKQLI